MDSKTMMRVTTSILDFVGGALGALRAKFHRDARETPDVSFHRELTKVTNKTLGVNLKI